MLSKLEHVVRFRFAIMFCLFDCTLGFGVRVQKRLSHRPACFARIRRCLLFFRHVEYREFISTGSRGCLPNSKKNGVSSVVALKLLLCATIDNAMR